MIPTNDQIMALWDTHALPDYKRVHMHLVCRVAIFFAEQLHAKAGITINTDLLSAAALLHDIDKAIPRVGSEHHPDTGVRILREAGMSEVADVVKTHPVHAILDQNISPKTWEEKILFLADKMVKLEIIDVDRRFALWRAESLPSEAQHMLNLSYPLVKKLEKEICELAGIEAGNLAQLA